MNTSLVDLRQSYTKDIGKSPINPSNEAGSSFYTDEYTIWLEQYLLKLLNMDRYG